VSRVASHISDQMSPTLAVIQITLKTDARGRRCSSIRIYN
jgi:hypothetical protein